MSVLLNHTHVFILPFIYQAHGVLQVSLHNSTDSCMVQDLSCNKSFDLSSVNSLPCSDVNIVNPGADLEK